MVSPSTSFDLIKRNSFNLSSKLQKKIKKKKDLVLYQRIQINPKNINQPELIEMGLKKIKKNKRKKNKFSSDALPIGLSCLIDFLPFIFQFQFQFQQFEILVWILITLEVGLNGK